MTEVVQEINLVQKLAKIRAISDVAKKDKKGFNYTYTDITSILANVTAGMKKYNVSLYPSIVHGTENVQQLVSENTKVSKTGGTYLQKTTEIMVYAEMIFRWVNDDNPADVIDVPWFVVGSQSDPSQAFGSGLTYTMRQFLTAFFQIAQADTDVDAYRSKQKAAEASEDKEIASEIIKEFDKLVRSFVANNPEREEDVKKFVSKYASKGNYLAIKDPSIASQLLNDFTKRFIGGAE